MLDTDTTRRARIHQLRLSLRSCLRRLDEFEARSAPDIIIKRERALIAQRTVELLMLEKAQQNAVRISPKNSPP